MARSGVASALYYSDNHCERTISHYACIGGRLTLCTHDLTSPMAR